MPMWELAAGQRVAYETTPIPILLWQAEPGWQDACWRAEEQASRGEVGLKAKGI